MKSGASLQTARRRATGGTIVAGILTTRQPPPFLIPLYKDTKQVLKNHRIIKRQNGKQYKGKPNMVQYALARRIRQGCTGPTPPPHPTPA